MLIWRTAVLTHYEFFFFFFFLVFWLVSWKEKTTVGSVFVLLVLVMVLLLKLSYCMYVQVCFT